MIIIKVPFIYEAHVIKPRCKKPVVVLVRDVVEVQIKQCTQQELPVAIICTDYAGKSSELRWDGQRLFDVDFETIYREAPRVVNIEEVLRNTEDCSQYKYSCKGPAAPFHNFWHHVGAHGTHAELKSVWLKDECVVTRDAIVCREWVSDNRDEVIAVAHSIASNSLVMDGQMMAPTSEPTYYTICFGLGNNHSSTALMSGNYNPKLATERFEFNANQLEEAIAYTTMAAKNRGDTKSLPIKPHVTYEVLIAEAVKMPPNQVKIAA